METKELICVTCPIGCVLSVQVEHQKVVSVSGNTCKRGAVYAENEITAPKRVLTTTVKTKSGEVVPVKTNQPILKSLLFCAMQEINKVTVLDDVKIGDVVVSNLLNTGADVVATANK